MWTIVKFIYILTIFLIFIIRICIYVVYICYLITIYFLYFLYFLFPKFCFMLHYFVEYLSDLYLFIQKKIPRYDITAWLYSREGNSTMLRQPKLLCLLSLLLRMFNSLKSADEQSTEYNSLGLIYFVRFILFA